jgi:NADP-dependent 3-hydroxy acid dehydrogenase YdfG
MSANIDRVIVTGASSGIGFDVARLFLEAGSRVVINARDPEKLERARRALGHEGRVVPWPARSVKPPRCGGSWRRPNHASTASTCW